MNRTCTDHDDIARSRFRFFVNFEADEVTVRVAELSNPADNS